MKLRRIALVFALTALGLLGFAGATLGVGESTGSVSVCATATSPVQTISANGVKVGTIPPKVATNCATTSYTIPTSTVTGPTTTVTSTVTGTVGTTTVSTTNPPGTLLFGGDFNQYQLGRFSTQSISPWSYISDPDPTSPNPPTIINDPYGSGEKAIAVTVDPTDTVDTVAGAASRSDIVGPHAFASQGLEIWWMFEIAFPSVSVNGAAYVPTNGDWNWNMQWHAESVGGVGSQPFAMGVSTGQNLPLTNCNGNEGSSINPQLFYYFGGGDIVNGVKPAATRVCTLGVIQYDHWYMIVGHRKWATDSSGLQETWIDGNLVNSTQRATLFRDAATGSVDNPFFELGNYRWGGQSGGVNWSSTIMYKKFRIGTTREIVGG
jgi:hypothetical protein